MSSFSFTPKTVILSDLDGTAMELLHDPAQRRVDPKVMQAFNLFHENFPNQVIPITGRDWEQILDCFDGEPHFPVISSNGAQLHLPGGKEFTHAFSKEEMDFLHEVKDEMRAFQKLHPPLVTEIKRFEIGFHSSRKTGFENISDDIVNYLGECCRGMFERLNLRAQKRLLDFRIEGTEVTHRCLNHAGINKYNAILEFAPHLPTLPRGDDWSHVVYLGDCFLYGNDRDVAIEVKKRGGKLIQIINNNENRIPEAGDPAEPDFAVATPSELGECLLGWTENVVKLSGPKRDAKPTLRVVNGKRNEP